MDHLDRTRRKSSFLLKCLRCPLSKANGGLSICNAGYLPVDPKSCRSTLYLTNTTRENQGAFDGSSTTSLGFISVSSHLTVAQANLKCLWYRYCFSMLILPLAHSYESIGVLYECSALVHLLSRWLLVSGLSSLVHDISQKQFV